MKFNNKRVLVTGATRGIGRAIAISMATQGAEVYALGRSGFDQLLAECESQSVRDRLRPITCDLNDWSATAAAVAELGCLDCVVNNAGVAMQQPIGQVTESVVNNQFQVNVFAALNVSQTASHKMAAGGSIVNVSSQASSLSLPRFGVYAATKAALDSLTRSLASELGEKGVRVNSVNPGVVMTDLGKEFWSDPAAAAPMLACVPLNRFVEMQDVVNAVEFLLSDLAGNVTGVCMPVDGGLCVNRIPIPTS